MNTPMIKLPLCLKRFSGSPFFLGKRQNLLCKADPPQGPKPQVLSAPAQLTFFSLKQTWSSPTTGPLPAVSLLEMLSPHFFSPLAPGHLADRTPRPSAENFFHTSLTRPNHHMHTLQATGDTPAGPITVTVLHLWNKLIMVRLPY